MRGRTASSIAEETMAAGQHCDNVRALDAMTRHLGDIVRVKI